MVQIQFEYQGELRCSARHGPSSSEVVTDAPVDNCGRGESFSPTDLVATALGACMLTIMGIVADRHGWNLVGARATVDKGMQNQPVRRIARLGIELWMPEQLDQRARDTLEAAARSCPVWHSLNPDIELPVTFHWGIMTKPVGASARHLTPAVATPLLVAALLVLVFAGLTAGSAGGYGWRTTLQGVLAWLGWSEPLEGSRQTIVELRLFRTLVAAGVGGALALSGGLLQGLFRNGLASPSMIGVTAGASLGASLAILSLGGYGVDLAAGGELLGGMGGPVLVTAASFVGALAAALFVLRLATRGGQVSVPSLLMIGIALNACVGGALAAIQSWSLRDVELNRAILTWVFGSLEDRFSYHVAIVWGGLALVLVVIPMVAVELDLFAGGEEDALALGVNTRRVKWLSLIGAALAAACAVSVAGQIAFVGLIVPHLVRLLTGSSHRSLLPLSILAGAVFLVGADLSLRTWLRETSLQPGVLMSLVGGPFFLYLIWRDRRAVEGW